jgi:hypothetical protein
MKALSIACLALFAGVCAARASPLADLYVDAAAVTMRCTGRTLSDREAATLAAQIAKDGGERISARALLDRIAQAKNAFSSADCTSPTAQIHIFLVTKVLLPDTPSPSDGQKAAANS